MSAAAAPALAASGLGFAYRDGHAVEGIDLELAAGELVGLLGPNGAGKSTLVRVLSGVLGPYRGSIRLLGRELSSLGRREIARALAVVPQESVSEVPFTALETVLLGRHPHLSGLAFESAHDVELAERALERVGAGALADRPLAELSSGERQRVVAARALAQATPVLLLDEPTSFLDLRYQVELFDLLRELAREGRALLAVLHDLNLAAEYCDRVALLAGGRIAAAGPTAEVLTYPHLTRVYGTEVYVDVNDLTGSLVVTPLSARAREKLGSQIPSPPGGSVKAPEDGP
jgi:ABC-type cobalamin/Fe3+-siderophores transport system ATPase subunit